MCGISFSYVKMHGYVAKFLSNYAQIAVLRKRIRRDWSGGWGWGMTPDPPQMQRCLF